MDAWGSERSSGEVSKNGENRILHTVHGLLSSEARLCFKRFDKFT